MGERGLTRIGRVISHDPSNSFIFYIDSEETGATNLPVCASPGSEFFHLPAVGSYIKYLDGSSNIKRYLGLFNDDPDKWYGATVDGKKIKDPNANPSNITVMDVGDTFVGKHGRAYFNGDAFVHSEFFRSKIFLRDDGPAELKAYNFRLNSEDGGVSIFTEASVTTLDEPNKIFPTFGDSLTLRRTLASGQTSTLRFDHTGKVALSIMDGVSEARFDTNGDIGINCGTDGGDPSTPFAHIRLINQVKVNNQIVPAILDIHSGSLSSRFDKAASLSCESLGVTVTNNATINAAKVLINGGQELAYKAALAKLDKIVKDLIAKFNTHTHIYSAGPAAGAITNTTVDQVSGPSIGTYGTDKTVAG